MNNLLWNAVYQDGHSVLQQENGKYNCFTDLQKSGLISFSVFNKNNNCNYLINLKTGQFVFNGVPFSPSIQFQQLDLDCICNKKYNYAKELFWYNEMACNFDIISNSCGSTQVLNTFVGYSINLQIPITIDNKNGFITKARPMLKIISCNNRVTFSNCLTFKYFDSSINQNKIICL